MQPLLLTGGQPWLIRGVSLRGCSVRAGRVPWRDLVLHRHRDTFKQLEVALATSFLKYLSGSARKIPLCLLLCGE